MVYHIELAFYFFKVLAVIDRNFSSCYLLSLTEVLSLKSNCSTQKLKFIWNFGQNIKWYLRNIPKEVHKSSTSSTGWSRKIETVFLSYELSCKEKCLKIYFGKLSLIMKLQNATELLSVSCSWSVLFMEIFHFLKMPLWTMIEELQTKKINH